MAGNEKTYEVQIVDIYTTQGCYECSGNDIIITPVKGDEWIEVSEIELKILREYFTQAEHKRRPELNRMCHQIRPMLVVKENIESQKERVQYTLSYAKSIIEKKEEEKRKKSEKAKRAAETRKRNAKKKKEQELLRLAKELGKEVK
jgi:hypothetical protein